MKWRQKSRNSASPASRAPSQTPASATTRKDLPAYDTERHDGPSPQTRHLPRLLGGLVRRRPAADPLGAVPRRGRRGGLRVARAPAVTAPAHPPGAALRGTEPTPAHGATPHHPPPH